MTTTRRRIYRIPHAHILNLLRQSGVLKLATATTTSEQAMPIVIPEGAKVVSVQSNYSAQAFDFVVEHESFAEVQECAELPIIRSAIYAELKPAEVFSVGSVIREELKARDWSLDELASKMGGAPYPRLLQLIRAQQGCPRIDLNFAQRLASALGANPEFWLRIDDTWHANKGWAQ